MAPDEEEAWSLPVLAPGQMARINLSMANARAWTLGWVPAGTRARARAWICS